MTNNEGFTGFLIKKTIQQYPIREPTTNFNEFRDRNIILYLQKKFGDLRQRNGNINNKEISKAQLDVKPQFKRKTPVREVPSSVDKKVLKLIQEQFKDEHYVEQFCIETEATSKVKKSRKPKLDTQQQLSHLMNQNIDEATLLQYYKQYLRQNLKATINEVRVQNEGKKTVITNKIGGLTNVEIDDQEQVNFFLSKICEQQELDACKILNVQNDNIKFKQEVSDEKEIMKNIVQKRITQDQMHQILHDDEKRQNNQLVKIFKETRIDQFDPDFFKNKIKMTTMKRVNEAQDQQFQNFFQTNESPAKQNQINKESFYRKRKMYASPKSKIVSPMSSYSRPASSFAFTTRSFKDNSFTRDMNKLLTKCDNAENQIRSDTNLLRNKMDQMEFMVDRAALYLNTEKAPQGEVINTDFDTFQKQRKFKKKFVSYLIDRVEKQSDLLSLKVKTDRSRKLIQSLLQQV